MRRFPVLARVGAMLQVAALACLLIAFLRRFDVRDGAYFGDAVNGGSAASTPWLVASGVLLMAGTVALAPSWVSGAAAWHATRRAELFEEADRKVWRGWLWVGGPFATPFILRAAERNYRRHTADG